MSAGANAIAPKVPSAVLVAILGTAGGVACLWLVTHVPQFGRFIPSPNITSDYLSGWLWAVALFALIVAIPINARREFCLIWTVKAWVVLLAMLPYNQHYGAIDAEGIYWMGANFTWHNGPPGLDPATRHIVYFAMAVGSATRTSFFAMDIVFAFLGLAGIYLLYRAACLYVGSSLPRLALLIGLVPSVVFWSSIIDKDPVTLLGTGLYSFGTVGWLRRSRGSYLIAVVVGIALASFIRGWYLAIFALPLAVIAGSRLRTPASKLAGTGIGACGAAYALRRLAAYFSVTGISGLVAEANSIIVGFSSGPGSGSAQKVAQFTSLASLLVFLPWGAFTVLFRPMLWDVHNAFTLAAAVENTIILALLCAAAWHWRSISCLRDPVLLWAGMLLVVWGLLYGIGAYGNLGMASRERLQATPFLIFFAGLLGTRRGRELAFAVQPAAAAGAQTAPG